MPTIDEVLAKPTINYGSFRTLEMKGCPEAELEQALSRWKAGSDEAKEAQRKRWRDANGAGDPYAASDFKSTPFPDHVKKYKTFEGWFDYFYSECSEAKQKEFFKECLTPDRKPKGAFAATDVAQRDAARKNLLRRMLDAGFVAYEQSFFGTNDDLLKPIDVTTPLTPLKVGFRGELRPPSLVKLHDGCRAKAGVDAIRKDMGMNERWHPFSDPDVRRKAYYRNGSVNQDNCLFTTVSVATDFETASKFPLLTDLNIDNPDALGTATVLARGFQSRVKTASAQYDAKIQAARRAPRAAGIPAVATPNVPADAERRLLRCVRMNIYLFTMQAGWNTEAKQLASNATTFPERATLSIPWGNFLARVRCERIQYDGDDSNKGHLLVVRGYDLLQSHSGLLAAAGGNRFVVLQLEAFLDRILREGSLDANGKGGIHVDPGNDFPVRPIEKVERIEAIGDWR